jgi:FAD/FMN-containing dehydrogenase
VNSKLHEQLGAAVSGGGISRQAREIEASLTDNPLVDAGTAPYCIVRPKDAGELKEIVELANREKLNLTVMSSSGRHFRGGIAARGENVLVDLASWKTIERIDRRNRVCLIGPGVTYGELSDALKGHGMTVPMPLSPRSGKSVVASVTDREPSTWPNRQWDWGDPVGSTETIFGNGSLFRTGSAGGPGTLQAQWEAGGAQKYSGGPSQTDLFRIVQGSQGTMGIVTWITIRAEMLPSVRESYLVGADDPGALIPFVYDVCRCGLGEHAFILSRRALGMLMAGSDGKGPDGGYDLPVRYACLVTVAGFTRLARQRVRYQRRDIREIADGHGLLPAPRLGKLAAEDLFNTATRPCGEVDWRLAPLGDCLSIFFLTTLNRAPSLAAVFADTAAEHGIDADDVGVYIQPVVQNHACHVEVMLPFDRREEGRTSRIRALEKEAVGRLADAGAFFSRPYGPSQDIAFDRHPMHRRLLKQVKDIFDPGRVLNRGKWGL